jgi:hypothetical protein
MAKTTSKILNGKTNLETFHKKNLNGKNKPQKF